MNKHAINKKNLAALAALIVSTTSASATPFVVTEAGHTRTYQSIEQYTRTLAPVRRLGAAVTPVAATHPNIKKNLSTLDAVDREGLRCDRYIRVNTLNTQERAALESGAFVAQFTNQNTGYVMGYIWKLVEHTPDLVMGVYSSCAEHAGLLGGFIRRSRYEDGSTFEVTKNPFRVFYEYHVPSPFSNSEYAVNNRLSEIPSPYVRDQKGLILNSSIAGSTDASFSPRWLDGYLSVVPFNATKNLVVACNYQTPRTSNFRDRYNNESRAKLSEVSHNLNEWINRVAADPRAVSRYRARTQQILNWRPPGR
jgi:hypothetical protein